MLGSRLLKFGGLLAVSAGLVTAGPYFSENFDSITPGVYINSGSPVNIGANFLLTSGSIDLLGPSYFPGLCSNPAVNHCVDISGNQPGTLVSVAFNLPAGTFNLNFVLNGTGASRPLGGVNTASAHVLVTSDGGTLVDQIFTLHYTDTGSWVLPFSVGSDAAGLNTRITFISIDDVPGFPGIATGLILDNVSVTDFVAAPEPATVALGLLGLPLIWFGTRRKRS